MVLAADLIESLRKSLNQWMSRGLEASYSPVLSRSRLIPAPTIKGYRYDNSMRKRSHGCKIFLPTPMSPVMLFKYKCRVYSHRGDFLGNIEEIILKIRAEQLD